MKYEYGPKRYSNKFRYGRFINGETVIFFYECAVVEKTYYRHRTVGQRNELEGIYPMKRKLQSLTEFIEKGGDWSGHIDIFLHKEAEYGVGLDGVAADDAGHFCGAVAAVLAIY